MATTTLGTRNDDRRTHIERLNGPEDAPMTDAQFAALMARLDQFAEAIAPITAAAQALLDEKAKHDAMDAPVPCAETV